MTPHPNDPKGEAGSKKTPLHLLPPFALAQTALAHAEGAQKYGPWNWRKTGVCATTYVGAIMRHITAWQDGEDLDPDSGLSHLAKVAACCNILLDAAHCGTLMDDRNKLSPLSDGPLDAAHCVTWMVDRNTTPTPSDGLLTVREWLETLPDGYRERALKNMKPWKSEVRCDTLARAVDAAFWWDGSPEGYRFWRGVMHCANGTADLPPLPEDAPLPEDPAPSPSDLPKSPPLPEGYSRWVYRGKGWKSGKRVKYAYWRGYPCDRFVVPRYGNSAGNPDYHYIEAVK